MVKIKEGFKGERLVSLPEELLASYRREPLINNLYVRKIGFFPRVKYHFLQKEHGCDYAMLIYCTEGKGWYRILGKQYTVEKYQYIIIPPGIPYSFGADEGDPWTIYWLHFQGKLRDQFLPSHPVPVTILPNEYSRLQDRLRLFEEIYSSFSMGYIKEYMIYSSMCLYNFLASFIYLEQFRHIMIPSQKEYPFTARVIHYMRENIQQNLTLKELASYFKYSPSHFSALFFEGVSKPSHPLFLCAKSELSQARTLLLPKVYVTFGIRFFVMAKLHFRPYIPNQTVLFPQRIDENIAENAPVRIVNAIVDNLHLDNFKKLYKETGRCPYHPKMMLKVILYAYMNNIYSCRKIEQLLLRDIHYIWLSGYEKPDFITINRFRNRVKEEINNVFTQLVLVLADKGFISLDVEYIDGTKIESKANKYTFVWRKTVERNRAKLMDKIRVLLEQVDEAIAQENSVKDTPVEFSPAMLSDIVNELKDALEHAPEPNGKEEKKTRRQKEKQIKELESHRDKLMEYDNHLDILGGRNSYSKTDHDATFMRMKEDAMKNGQTKPGYNLQIGTENQFITDFGLFPNPTDTLTLIPFFTSFLHRYDRLPGIGVADSGYGSEENYRFMQENAIEAFVKYNFFHKEQRPRYAPNPFHPESIYYNEDEDYYVCPMGQHMNRIGTKRDKTASGYVTQSARYKAQRCEGCPLRGSCFKARGNRIIEVNHRLNEYKRRARERLTSQEGIKHRGRRCIEPEAVFGQMKYNMAYRRFRHVGKDKVTMDFAFFAIAFNIKKMCAKLAKEGYTTLYKLIYTLYSRRRTHYRTKMAIITYTTRKIAA